MPGPQILVVEPTTNFKLVYQYLHGDFPFSLWEPLPSPGFFNMGWFGKGSMGEPTTSVLTVKVGNSDPDKSPLLMPPERYVEVGTIQSNPIVFPLPQVVVWQPIAPPNYVPSGMVMTTVVRDVYPGPPPPISAVKCLRYDKAQPVTQGGNHFPVGIFQPQNFYTIEKTNLVWLVNAGHPTNEAYIPKAAVQSSDS